MIHVVCVARTERGQVILPQGQRLSRWSAVETLGHIIRAHCRDCRATHEHVRIISHLLEGEPASALVDFAYRHHASQIFIGIGDQRHPSGIGRVAAEVLDLSEIPVHLEAPFSNCRTTDSSMVKDWSHKLQERSLFGAQISPWRSPPLA